jgi:hypothetical protein
MKLCKDCRNYDFANGRVCVKSIITDLVTGEESMRSCQETREDVALCGKDAIWFEPRKPEPP